MGTCTAGQRIERTLRLASSACRRCDGIARLIRSVTGHALGHGQFHGPEDGLLVLMLCGMLVIGLIDLPALMAWAVVGIPVLWGAWFTLVKTAALF